MNPRKPSSWVLPVAAILYLIALLPTYGKSPFIYDSFFNVWRSRQIVEDPSSLVRPDFMGRFGPLYTVFFFLMDRWFGFNSWVYGGIDIFLHLVNFILLFLVLRRLAGRETPALLASVFFLFSSTQWGVLWTTGQTMRLACAGLSLASLLFFIRFIQTQRKIDVGLSLLFFAATFGLIEDAISLPLLLLAILILFPPRPMPGAKKFLLMLPFFLISLIYASLSITVEGPKGWGLTLGPHILVNLLFSVKELVQFLLIPRPELIPFSGVPGLVLRLLPAFLIFLWVGPWWFRKKIQIETRFLIFGIAWMVITSLLYSLRPFSGVWQGRYLYIPGIGAAMVAGSVLYAIRRFSRHAFAAMAFYVLLLNISTTLFMIQKSRNEIKVATHEEIPIVYSLVSQIRDQLKTPIEIPPNTTLIVEGLPFSTARLEELLRIYYASVPDRIIEASEGQAVNVSAGRVLYVRLSENGLLNVEKRR